MLLLFYATQKPTFTEGYVNFAVTLASIWTALNATGPQDAVFWSASQMYEWFDQAATLMGRTMGVFVEYDNETLITDLGVGDYPLWDQHVSTVQADLNKVILRARNVQELEAVDADWPRTVGPPVSFAQDVQGVQLLTLYPAPDASNANKPIGLVYAEVPATVSVSNAILRAPQCMQEYFSFYALSEARIAETHAQMPEAAQFFGGIVDLITQTIGGLWGRDDG